MWSFHHRIRHSWDVEIDLLLVGCKVELVVRVRWCSVTMFGRNKFFHCVCACAWFHRFSCSIVSMHDANVFRQFHKFPCSIWRAKFFMQTFIIDLLWTGRFSFLHKNTFCVLRFPRSITDWIGFGLGLDWVGLESSTRGELLQKTVERVFQLAVVQLYNPIDHSLWSNCDRVLMRSLVVVEETNIVFHTRLL